jgi:hypothetical protein
MSREKTEKPVHAAHQASKEIEATRAPRDIQE